MSVRYYPLINKLINAFDIREKLSLPDSKNLEIAFANPFITIAREPGSGGRPIAQLVAKKLKFKFIDEVIIDELAKSTKKRKEIVKAVDEKSRSWISDMVHSLLNEEYIDDVKYMTELVRIILTFALKGHVVILGRGANFMTPFEKGLHVNVTSPRKVRILRAMEFESLDENQAKDRIAKIEKERKDFVKQFLHKDITKVNSYDLNINTSSYSIAQAADLIVHAYKTKFPVKRFIKFGYPS